MVGTALFPDTNTQAEPIAPTAHGAPLTPWETIHTLTVGTAQQVANATLVQAGGYILPPTYDPI